ncbi:homeobox-leucine zipper protein ROC9 [Setaria italica]|uniref:homeobox-leucine zipper protein ROC9 n=1 Tax=Setaria italica TaxID=4555 RepID=UPI0006455F56|nr:homeobox-leucine zipper protein ROC9 [Setaria italica]
MPTLKPAKTRAFKLQIHQLFNSRALAIGFRASLAASGQQQGELCSSAGQMGSSRPPPRTQDFFPAPALSLSLAVAFGRNEPAASGGEGVEAGDEGDGGIRLRQGEAAEISSENTGPGSQSGGAWSGGEEAAGHGDGGGNKRRKSYHRHTAEQIKAMEAVFRESPHPDEKQRQQLSQELGLSARQVKFWFQNRRTQIKATQERHENSLLKSEMEKLQEENRAMRELVKKSPRCPGCGAAAASTEEQQLRLENAKLKAEIERLRGTPGNTTTDAVASPASPSCSAQAIQIKSRSSVEGDVHGGGLLGRDKTSILELAGRALHELATMCSSGEPLWVRSAETGRDVLDYDEYARLFQRGDVPGDQRPGWSVEASRETGVVYLDTTRLVNAFMDVNQWMMLFPTMISKAATLGVIQVIENDDQDGVVQLMFAEVQTLTPLVPTREFNFLRHCKKLTADKWAMVDVSVDDVEPEAQTTSSTACKCLKKPSGCVVEEQSNGRCKVTWVEHATCRNAAVPSMYRSAAASGLAFGARRWVAALQLQCERMVFSVATNIPARDSSGVATPAGRRSVLKLAHRMTSSLCRVIGGSRDLAWSRPASNRGGGQGDGVRMTSRRNIGDPGEPRGLIACAVLSAWLPVNPAALFDFLRDESRRHEWDVMLPPGRPVQSCASVAKGKDRRNCVTAYAARSPAGEQGSEWILQDSSTNPCECTVAYAPVDAAALRPVIDGHDSSGVALLPCGFAVMPDGLEPRPSVITSRKGEEESRAAAEAGGSLVTVAFQALASSSPTADDALPPDSVEAVAGLASCALGNIKKAMRCEDC